MTCVLASLTALLHPLKKNLKRHTRPATGQNSHNTLVALTRSRKALLLENAFLRQQVAILERQVSRPKITRRDRLKLLFLARLLPSWKSLLQIVQPETLLRRHRDLFKTFRMKKSGTKNHPRRISGELMALIQQMSVENRLWGAERIRGELLKLGITLSKRTIQKYLLKGSHAPGQSWATFLQNHAHDIFVSDFTVVHDFFFRPIYLFVVMHLATRQIMHFNFTRNPTGSWMAQQMREISPWKEGPRFLICDNDALFGDAFEEVAASVGTEIVHTPLVYPAGQRTLRAVDQKPQKRVSRPHAHLPRTAASARDETVRGISQGPPPSSGDRSAGSDTL